MRSIKGSINDFVAGRVAQIRESRQRNPGIEPSKFTYRTPDFSRRGFLKRTAAVVALAGFISAVDMVEPNFARAANAVVYVDSAAVGANNGTTWANAYTTLSAAIAASVTTGTDFCISSAHVESGTGPGFTFKGVAATPDRAFSCDKTNSPPQTSDLLKGAAFTATAGAVSINGFVYCFGFVITGSTTNQGTAIGVGNAAAGDIIMDSGSFNLNGAATNFASFSTAGSGFGTRATVINSTFQVTAAGSAIINGGGDMRWLNTPSMIQGGTIPTNLISFPNAARSGFCVFDSLDLTAMSGKTIVPSMNIAQTLQFINCSLPASVTLASTPNQPQAGPVDFITTDNTAVNTSSFQQARYMYQGTLSADNTVYNGATDGSNAISWKIVTTANDNPQSPFECFDIEQWVAPGTYAASTVVATSASAGLTNNDLWAEVIYMASASNPLGSRVANRPLNQIPQGSSPTSLATGATWATGGLGNNYTIAIPSFTVALAGMVRFRVRVAKPSITVNVDPKVLVA